MKKQNTTTKPATTKATTSKAPRENPVPQASKANKLTLTALGKFAQDYADPDNELATITDENLRSYGVVESKAGLLNSARGIYLAANFMASCRESAGWEKENKAELDAAAADVRKKMNTFFKAFGQRPGRRAVDAARPLYCCTDADLFIIGENAEAARKKAEDGTSTNWEKVETFFLEYLVLSCGRLIAGKPLERVSEKDFKAAKTANNQAKKEKAAKTKEANKQKADAAEETRNELEAAKAELKELKSRAINMQAVLALVMASHATPEEKEEIVTLLSGKTSKQAERAAHVAASKATPKAKEQPAA